LDDHASGQYGDRAMMTVGLLLSALGLLAAPGLLRPLARRLPPAEWAALCALLLAAGAVVLEVLAVLVALPTVMRAAGLPEIADLCQEALGRLIPGGAAVGWAAFAAAMAVPILATREALRTRRARRAVRAGVRPVAGELLAHHGHPMLVVPSDRLVAFSVPGSAPRVVISRGLADHLSDGELTAVLHHELAHLRNRHHRYLLLASVVEASLGLLWPVRRSAAALRAALERWADEQAAATSAGGRSSVRSALLRVAASMAGADPRLAAFLTASTMAERIEALQAESQPHRVLPRRLSIYAPAVLLLLGAPTLVGAILGRADVLHHLAGICPSHPL
jgi:Zn-dependent protease with chaperone function